MPEVKEGIERVLGRRSEEAIRLMDEISKIASALDWIVPYEQQSRMIEEVPMSGVSKVEWKPKPKKEDDFELDTKQIGLDIDAAIGILKEVEDRFMKD